MNRQARPVRSVATSFLDALLARGIRHVFANAGTDFAPVIEALVQAKEQGRQVPHFHTVPHENVAVAMAHGYYLACGEPAAVMVHVTVGTANALCGIMNAARDNVPVLLMAGHTPNTETGHAGSRSVGIHWGQDSFDQGGIVREYVKWDYELRAGQSVETIVNRALDIAMSEPRGPVYLTLPREVLGDTDATTPALRRDRSPGAVPAEPAPEGIQAAAAAIAQAEFPLILTAIAGRDPSNLARLERLAEKFGVAVGYPGEPGPREVSIPADHPMYVGVNPMAAIEQADVIVALDCEVPWWPRYVTPRPGAKLIHIAPDPFFSRYPLRGFEMDLAIAGSTSAALQHLLDALVDVSRTKKKEIQARRKKIEELARERVQRNEKLMREAAAVVPIHPAWVAACVNRVRTPETIVVNELGVPMDLLDLGESRSYISSSPAGGLGFGLGASLGAKLAAPQKAVIAIIGDGSYMFGNPVSAHFVARSERLATLTVVMNNGRWHAVDRSTTGMYPDGRAAAAELMPLVALSPSPEFERIIEACGGHGERVEAPDQLEAALRRGLAKASAGTPALINVITGH
ncbi:MAG TPA: thiamine pyrophosphate-requiring protein [Gammaproteobacteria bacterium]